MSSLQSLSKDLSAEAINEQGHIVGSDLHWVGDEPLVSLGWLLRNGTKCVLIDRLESNADAWLYLAPLDLNEAGHIMGVGGREGDGIFPIRGFLLEPVGEPEL